MSTQSHALRQAMANANTGAELNALAAELTAVQRAEAARKAAEADLDWAATAVAATLTPVAVHTVHTAASDWLGDIPDGSPDSARRLVAEASLWYTRLHPDVLADDQEFAAQARTAAARAAGRLRIHPAAATEQFLDYVHFVRKRAGSGLPQIDQMIDANNMPAPTPYPADVFDNFAPAVDPVNAGVTGTETSDRAPVLQELMGGGRAVATPGSAVDGGQVPDGDDNDPQADDSIESDQDAGSLNPNLARRRTAAMPEYDYDDDLFGPDPDRERDLHHEEMRRRAEIPAVDPETARLRERERAREYQMLRYYDDAQEYGEDYARRAHPLPYTPHTSASTLDQIQQTTAPDGVTSRPTPLPQDVAFPWVISPNAENNAPPASGEMAADADGDFDDDQAGAHTGMRRRADQWHGQEWPHAVVQPDAANNPGNTPTPPTGTAAQGAAAAAADHAADDTAPTYADASWAAPDYARAYAQTYSTTPDPARGRDIPPGMSGPPTRPARLSHLLSTPEERANPDYAAGYLAGSTWKAAGAIPRFGNDAYEAGLYAGILDNPAMQKPFTTRHRRAAAKHNNPAAGRRIARHAAASAHLAGQSPTRLTTHGPYLRTQAATSTDLDTMAPGTSADPTGNTPFNGPGRPPILEGQYGAADPAGPAPYNGAPPYGAPAVPTSAAAEPTAGLVPDTGMTTPNRATAFRRTIQANLARAAAGAPLLTLTFEEAR